MEFIRKWLQVIFTFAVNGNWSFPFTRGIYQGPLKVICSPGLNCYSCPASTTYCPIGSLQNLIGGVRLAIENGQHFFGLSVLGGMGVLGGLFGRLICGWMCPFGFVQEMLHKISSKKVKIPRLLNYGKYGVLLVFVVLLPLFMVDDFGSGGPWFCKTLCPAGTLEAGLPLLLLQPHLRSTLGVLFVGKMMVLVLFMVWSVFSSRPFCRVMCPLGAFYGLFSRVRLVRMQLDKQRCTNCEACHAVCPMEVKFNENPNDPECITCMACMSKACKCNAIYVEIGGVPIHAGAKPVESSSADVAVRQGQEG
jgi:polyferredoxin